MRGPASISGPPNMLPNLFRQSFWAVFVPLLVAAGLFWMDELRGYRGEMSLLVLPRADLAKGAAANLAALAREIPFATAVYEDLDGRLENPLVGKTPAERKAIWRDIAEIKTVGTSDVVRIVTLAGDQDEALALSKAVAAELVRTASRYYNQKTDLDIRIVTDPVTIPSLSAWPRFVASVIATALFFTGLFFVVYGLIERVFPKRSASHSGKSEYVISPETFKPRKPAYWNRDEQPHPFEADSVAALHETASFVETNESLPDDASVAPADEYADRDMEADVSVAEPRIAPEEWPADLPVEEPIVEETFVAEEYEPSRETLSYEAERAGLNEEITSGYVTHAAAPDNLPIVEGPITPLQGAQSRLMKADIDATAEAYASLTEPVIPEEPAKPQTHEPTPEEYRRRLNELLSGKM